MWDAATRAANVTQPFSNCRVIARCVYRILLSLYVGAHCMLPEAGVCLQPSMYMDRESVGVVGVRRVVSRGNISSRSSDFGALEVFAGASIGHTDPYVVHAAISRRLSAVNSGAADRV